MLRDVARRVRNAMAFGVTTAPHTAPDNVAQVQVRLSALEVAMVKLVEQRGFASALPVGTPVVVLFHSGDRSNGAVMGSVSPKSRPALAGPEDAAMYGYGFSIMVRDDGVHIEAPDVFLSGNLHVKGEVTGKAEGGSVTLSQHRHPSTQAPTPGT